MTFTIVAGKLVAVVGSPIDIANNPAQATLTNQAYSSSDSAVFTVTADPAVPGGAIITAVGAGTATLLETATANEPDGVTTENIQGVATIVVTAVVIPPPIAVALAFTFGTPFDPAP